MKRQRARPLLVPRIKGQSWHPYTSPVLGPNGPKIQVSDSLVRMFPQADKDTAIKDLGDSAVDVWIGLNQAAFRDESPGAEVQQETVKLRATKSGQTATSSLVFHKGSFGSL